GPGRAPARSGAGQVSWDLAGETIPTCRQASVTSTSNPRSQFVGRRSNMQLLMSAIAVVALVIAGYIGYKIRDRQTRTSRRGYEWFSQNWLSQSGACSDYGSYRLESLDGGKNWYAAEWTEDGQVKIIGPAEACFPGLLKRLRAFDRLTDYV